MTSFDEWAGFDRPRSQSSRDVRSRHVAINLSAILSAHCMLSRRPQGSCPDACRTCIDGVISPVHFGDNRLVHDGRRLDRELAIDGASIVDRRCARDERADISSVSVARARDSSQPHGSTDRFRRAVPFAEAFSDAFPYAFALAADRVDRRENRSKKASAASIRPSGRAILGRFRTMIDDDRHYPLKSSFFRRNPGSANGDLGEESPEDNDESPESRDVASGNDPETYWTLSRAPLESLVFSMPLVLAYEGGVLLLGRGTPRNGAEVWLRHGLDALGFGSYFLLPLLTAIGLLAWHHVEHDRWRFQPRVLIGMAIESLGLAMLLLGIARLQERLWPLAAPNMGRGVLARIVGYCGAGLYEEVLFRLLLLPVVAQGLRWMGMATGSSIAIAILSTSLVFSAAHYVGPLGDSFEVYSFTFRTLAGCFFAILFAIRGFGITAGTHAAYDMLVGLLLASAAF